MYLSPWSTAISRANGEGARAGSETRDAAVSGVVRGAGEPGEVLVCCMETTFRARKAADEAAEARRRRLFRRWDEAVREVAGRALTERVRREVASQER